MAKKTKIGPLPLRERTFFKAYRKRAHLTQQAVADRIGMTKTRVSMKENGKEDWDSNYLERLSKAMGVSEHALLFEDPDDDGDEAPAVALAGMKPETRQKALDVIRALKLADERQTRED